MILMKICNSHICKKNHRKNGLFSIQFSCTTTNTTYLDNLRIHVKRMGARKQVNRRQSFNTMLHFLLTSLGPLYGSSHLQIPFPACQYMLGLAIGRILDTNKQIHGREMIHYPQAGIRSTRRKIVARALAKRRMLPASLW